MKQFKKNKGVMLLEVALGLSVLSLTLTQFVRFTDDQSRVRVAKNVGDHLKRVGEAADRFVNDNYTELANYVLGVGELKSEKLKTVLEKNGVNDNGGYVGCDSTTHTCTFTVSGLANAGYLQNNTQYFNNPVDIGYKLQIAVRKQDGSELTQTEIDTLKKAEYAQSAVDGKIQKDGEVIELESGWSNGLVTPVINGVVVTDKPWTGRNQTINYTWMGEAIAQAGVDAGAVGFNKGQLDAKGVYGYKSNWYLDRNDFPVLTDLDDSAGILAYRFGFHSNNYTDFLRRDGSLPMTGTLQMDNKPINLSYGGPSISANGDRVNISGPVNINNPSDESGVAPDNTAVDANGWICATNERPRKICLGGDASNDGNAQNFELRMYDERPLLIHNMHTATSKNTIPTTMKDGKTDHIVARIGGSLAVHDNLYLGDRTNDSGDILGKEGSARLNEAIKETTDKEGGNLISNYNIQRGGVVLGKNGRPSEVADLLKAEGKNRYEPSQNVATEFRPDGTIVTNNLYIRTPGVSEGSNGINTENGNGLHMSQIIPAYSSRGAFVVQDEDLVQKPDCSWKPEGINGPIIGRKGVPRIILSWGNIQTSGDEVDQTSIADKVDTTDPESIKKYIQEKVMTKHRVILKAEEIGEADAWRMIIKTRNFDGSGWSSAGQAIAHVYCQLY